jgi:hypothetical protein
LVAAAMIETAFPAFLRSLHQAVGTLVWLAIVTLATLAAAASRAHEQPAETRAAA